LTKATTEATTLSNNLLRLHEEAGGKGRNGQNLLMFYNSVNNNINNNVDLLSISRSLMSGLRSISRSWSLGKFGVRGT
jgi:hypothetical protein